VLNGTAFVLLYSLGTLLLGRLADRVDRRRMIAVGILFWSAMSALGSRGAFLRAGFGRGCAGLAAATGTLALVCAERRTAAKCSSTSVITLTPSRSSLSLMIEVSARARTFLVSFSF